MVDATRAHLRELRAATLAARGEIEELREAAIAKYAAVREDLELPSGKLDAAAVGAVLDKIQAVGGEPRSVCAPRGCRAIARGRAEAETRRAALVTSCTNCFPRDANLAPRSPAGPAALPPPGPRHLRARSIGAW